MAIATANRRLPLSADARTLITGATLAVSEAARRVQELEEVATDSLDLILIRRALDALDGVSDSLEFMTEE